VTRVLKCHACGRPFICELTYPAVIKRASKVRHSKRDAIAEFCIRRNFLMGKNLANLNETLFAQLDRLSSTDLSGDGLKSEIERSRAVGGIARLIIDEGRLALDAHTRIQKDSKGAPGLFIEEPKVISDGKS
jgi:hypothetical protein